MAYELLEAAWLRKKPGRVPQPRSRLAFAALAAAGEDPALVAACGLRFLGESSDARAGMIPRLDAWLAERLFRGWEPAKIGSAATPIGIAAPRVAAVYGSWRDADAGFVEAVEAQMDPDWIASWLIGCGWDPAERAIVAPSGLRRDTIRRALGRPLAAHEIAIVVRKPGETAPAEPAAAAATRAA